MEADEVTEIPNEQLVKLTAAVEALREYASVLGAKPYIPLSVDLWDVEIIAAYLKRRPETVRQKIINRPDFPKAVRLPTGENEQSRPLWKAKEVIEWTEGQRDRPIVGRPRNKD